MDRLPAGLITEGVVCDHNYTTALSVYEVVGDGSGQEYRATCNLCGAKCGKAAISVKVQDPDRIPNGGTTIAAQPDELLSGWFVMTGGVGKVELVITDSETGEVAKVVVDATYDGNLQNNDWVMSNIEVAGRNKTTFRYNFSALNLDFTQLETTDGASHDFSGGNIKIGVNIYSLADPTAPAIKTDCWLRTLTVEAAN